MNIINKDNFYIDTMWSFLQLGGQKGNPVKFRESVEDLIQMMTQKTAGQRENKRYDLNFNDLNMVMQVICMEAICLVLDERYESAFIRLED